jgi:uncharacterized protein (TIGR02001 family)
MKTWMTRLGGALAAAAVCAGPALAADAPSGPSVAFNAAVTNDYVFRGLSQTGGDAAAQGGADLTDGQFYLGTWLSSVDFGPTAGDPADKTSLEYDLYGGFRPSLGPLSLDIGVIRYGYADSPEAAHYAYWEGKILASRSEGPLTLGAAFYYSPEFFGKTGDAEYYEVNATYVLASKASISGAVGFQDLQKSKAGLGGYASWNLGLGYPITDHAAIDLRYWGADHKATRFYGRTFAGDRLAATLKVAV